MRVKMGGGRVDDGEPMGAYGEVITMVLVGRTGNGKSATGNSIIGRKVFESDISSSGVTLTCGVEQTVLSDGRILKVVDTPGLFDPSVSAEFIGEEIVKCIEIAKDRVHCVLFVLSVRNRFTGEEAAAFRMLQMLFGDRIVNYMVIAFTGGDDLEANDKEFGQYLNQSPPELEAIIIKCNRRVVLFNNRTKSITEKGNQRAELLKHIDDILTQNEGQPYSNDLYREAQARSEKLCSQPEHFDNQCGCCGEELKSFSAQQLKQLTEMVEEKLKIATEKWEQRLAEARLAQEKSEEEIRKLNEKLQQAREETENLKKQEKSEVKKKYEEEIRQLHEKLEQAKKESENGQNGWWPKCIIM